MSKKLNKDRKALLEVSDRNLFRGLRICKLETNPGQIQEVFQIKKNKVKTCYSRKYICENYQSCSLGPRIVISQVSNSQNDECLEYGCQEVWSHPHGLDNACQVKVYMSPLRSSPGLRT